MHTEKYRNKVDFGIITIREDEFRAVINRFPIFNNIKGNRHYGISRIQINNNKDYIVAVVRCIEQGTGEAQDVARDMIEDLDPKWILLVGIACGVSEHEFSLGDIVLSTKLSDFCLEAVNDNMDHEYAIGGGSIHKEIQILLAHLPALESKLKSWNTSNSIGMNCPSISWRDDLFYGDSIYINKVREALGSKFNQEGNSKREPIFTCAPIVSSDRLIKSTKLIQDWRKYSRHIVAVEMELAGVYRAARRIKKEYPILAIRGISDIVGYKRQPLWTEYACHAAAAFTKAFIGLRPFEPKCTGVKESETITPFSNSLKPKEINQDSNTINYVSENRDIAFIDIEEYNKKIEKLSITEQYASLFDMIINLCFLSLEIFIITTIRCYEDKILNENVVYRKKIKPIKKIITDSFRKPSFKTISSLADRCYYLIDSKAPQVLQSMKYCLEKDFVLEDIGDFLDDLENLFPRKLQKIKFVDKGKTIKNLLKFVLPNIASYSNKSLDLLKEKILSNFKENRLDKWKNALYNLHEHFVPILTNEFILKKLDRIDKNTEIFIISTTKYNGGEIFTHTDEVPLDESEEFKTNITGMSIGDNQYIHLYPFLLIKDHSIYFYRRTLAAGYEYYSVASNRIHLKETKKKFSHTVFKKGSKQELFWTEVLPSINSINGIKANIPDEVLPSEFVGRKRQKKIIKQDIIEIPNQNGIIYGTGGVGKTALMLQISEELFDEENVQHVLFDNIVWVSAKSNYYEHIFNIIEQKDPQFRSLDGIITAILNFFENEGLEEYSFEDRKELVLEILEDNKILLILDNLESIPKLEADRIIKYFDTDVKRRLRKKPDYFKVIITSRKQIPSGFHQIELKGLDLRESELMFNNLFNNYRTSKPELTDEQKEKLYEATKGIPVVIKHCFAKIYEYNESLEAVIRKLPSYSQEIVQFSFREILNHVEKEKELIRLKILILLEIINYPLMLRQIADILETDEFIIEDKVPTLIDYQCLKRINQKNQEKYIVNDEIRILTKSLARKHTDISNRIRDKITTNYSIDRQMDYTSEELTIFDIFQNYLSDHNLLEAEDFIEKHIKNNPDSILLNYQYAKYLRETKKDASKAIEILEKIREKSRNHSSILSLLVASYTSLDIPNYEKASTYVRELERKSDDEEAMIKIAEFYVSWSTSIKMKRELDPLKERVRQERYRGLAKKALEIINNIKRESHGLFYLTAQSHFNCWDYENALNNINKAIALTSKSSTEALHSYDKFLKIILKRREFYSNKLPRRKRTGY